MPRALLLAAALAGCTHMPVTSLVKLAQVDLNRTDPARVRVAVKLPRAIEPRPRGVSLRIAVKLGNGHEESRDFVLRESTDPAEVLALQHELDVDTRIFAYQLDPGEVARLSEFRDELRTKQETSGGRRGSITISVRPDACRSDAVADGPIPMTTYLRTAETGSYVPLLRDVDLRTLQPARDLVALLPPCPRAGG